MIIGKFLFWAWLWSKAEDSKWFDTLCRLVILFNAILIIALIVLVILIYINVQNNTL